MLIKRNISLFLLLICNPRNSLITETILQLYSSVLWRKSWCFMLSMILVLCVCRWVKCVPEITDIAHDMFRIEYDWKCMKESVWEVINVCWSLCCVCKECESGYTDVFAILPKISVWLLKELILLRIDKLYSAGHIALGINFYVIF